MDNKPFNFSGTNAYYSIYLAARKDTNSLIELFSKVKSLNMKVIRIWGFYDSYDNGDPAIIQYEPGVFNETGLKGLDYVLDLAKQLEIKLIICLTNNWENYGGMNQYIEWLNKVQTSDKKNRSQKKIYRNLNLNDNIFYRSFINGYSHDIFYTHPKIREWYKNYIKMIISRINTINNIQYKNDPAIFAWELANEAESSDRTGIIILNWIKEMADYIKSIDSNHLIGSGESGFDIISDYYGETKTQYNNQHWLFNGDKGISYHLNIQVKNIDFASCHLYREDWLITAISGKIWIADHFNLARSFNKPFILAEYGSRGNKFEVYTEWLNTAFKLNIDGSMIWQLVYNNMKDNDGYFIYFPNDEQICNLLFSYSRQIENVNQPVLQNEVNISECFPNPCSYYTAFKINIPDECLLKSEIYSILGERLINQSPVKLSKGIHLKFINTSALPTGVYFARFILNNKNIIKKFQTIK